MYSFWQGVTALDGFKDRREAAITCGKYKDVPAIVLENEFLRAVYLPAGAKLASLVSKKTGREFFFQAPGKTYIPQPYDGDYCEGECSGFDDMFPNNAAATVNSPLGGPVLLPDHGETAALSWDWKIENQEVHFTVFGKKLPYRLTKKVALDQNRIQVSYEAENLSGQELPAFYASHPMIQTEVGGRLEVPFSPGARLLCCSADFPQAASFGDLFYWPVFQKKDGRQELLNCTQPYSPDNGTYKFYFTDTVETGRVAYCYPDGENLGFSYSPAHFPYLGFWINNGYFHGSSNLVIAISQCYLERVDLAKQCKRPCALFPGTSRWEYEISVS